MSFNVTGKIIIPKGLVSVTEVDNVDKRDQLIADLEEKLVSEKDCRREERFWWIFGTSTGLLFIYALYGPWLVTFFLIVLYLTLMASLADYLGVEWISVPLKGLLYWVRAKLGQKPQDY